MIIRLYKAVEREPAEIGPPAELAGRFLVDDDFRMLERVVIYNGERYQPYHTGGKPPENYWWIEQPELIVTDEHRMNTIDGPARPEEGSDVV